MIKITVAVIIVVICSVIGAVVAGNFKMRPWQLRQLQAGLQMLETEIAYASTHLPDAFAKIAKQLDSPVNILFKESGKLLLEKTSFNVNESWQKGLEVLEEESALTLRDFAVLKTLGYNLGKSDCEEQLKHLRLIKEQLKQHEMAAEEEKAKGERLWRYCGFLTGLLIVLLIL